MEYKSKRRQQSALSARPMRALHPVGVVRETILAMALLATVSTAQQFTNYLSTKVARDVALWGDTVWVATEGGVLKLSTSGEALASYSTSDGLTSNVVRSIGIASDGTVWCGTNPSDYVAAHVCRLDGDRWTCYSSGDGVGLGSRWDWVRCVEGDSSGTMWFGSGRGVTRLQGTEWTVYTSDDGLAPIEECVNGIDFDNAGNTWVAAWGGVSMFDGGGWTAWTPGSGSVTGSAVMDVAVDTRNNNVWLASDRGAEKYDGIQWTVFDEPARSFCSSPQTVAVTGTGSILVGAVGCLTSDNERKGGGGLYTFDGFDWNHYTDTNGMPEPFVEAIELDGDENAWMATPGGVVRFDGDTFRRFVDTNSLQEGRVWSIAIDRQGVVWFATGRTLESFDGDDWTVYDSSDGLPGRYVNDVAVVPNGDVWVATDRGACRIRGNTVTVVDTSHGLPSLNVRAVAVDQEQSVWMGTDSGVTKFDGTDFITYDSTDGMSGNDVRGVLVAPDGALWVRTYRCGVCVLDSTGWIAYDTTNGLLSGIVTTMALDSSGTMWFGFKSPKGLLSFDGDTWQSHSDSLREEVQTIAFDRSGNMWISFNDIGFSVVRNGSWTHFSTADGLADNDVTCFLFDETDNVWIGTYLGASLTTTGIAAVRRSPAGRPAPGAGLVIVPVSGGIRIRTAGTELDNASVLLVDITGRAVARAVGVSLGSAWACPLGTAELAPGHYLVQVRAPQVRAAARVLIP